MAEPAQDLSLAQPGEVERLMEHYRAIRHMEIPMGTPWPEAELSAQSSSRVNMGRETGAHRYIVLGAYSSLLPGGTPESSSPDVVFLELDRVADEVGFVFEHAVKSPLELAVLRRAKIPGVDNGHDVREPVYNFQVYPVDPTQVWNAYNTGEIARVRTLVHTTTPAVARHMDTEVTKV